jgi:tetrapyrrole methylase family protein/MazG family protein
MPTVTVIGLGPGPLSLLTKEAEGELLRADKVFFRTRFYPAYDWLCDLGKTLVSFDQLYPLPWPKPEDKYKFMVEALLKEAVVRGHAVYAVPGSPLVLEATTRMLRESGVEAGVEIRVVHGLSFIEPALAAVNFDWSMGLQVVMPWMHVRSKSFSQRLAMLVCQIEIMKGTTQWLLETYPPDHLVTLIWTAGLPAYETEHKVITLENLDCEYGDMKYFASLFVPPVS